MPRPDTELAARCLGVDYPSGHAVGSHTHDWDQLIYAVAGVARVFAEGSVWLVPPHRALVVPAGIGHDLSATGRLALRTIYTHPGGIAEQGGGCRAVEVSPLLRELVLHSVRLGRLRHDDPHEALCLQMMLHLMQRQRSATVQLPLPSDARGRAVADRLLADAADRTGIDALARAAGASRRTIERIFVDETGLTVGRWRRRLRLLRGLELLGEGLPVTTVALRVGYTSTSAFIARFSEFFGVTPGRYDPDGGR